MAEWSSIVCWYHISFIHSSIGGHSVYIVSMGNGSNWKVGFFGIYILIWLHQFFSATRGIFTAACEFFCYPACASLVVLYGLHACRLSSPTACGVLVLPPGMEPASPALEGIFLTTGPPQKSQRTLKEESEMVSFAISWPWECGKDDFQGGKTREEETSNRRSSWWWLPR